MKRWFFFLCAVWMCPVDAAPIDDEVISFVENYCLDCHDADTEKGGINLDVFEIDWQDPHAAELWTKVHAVVESGDMPPEEKTQPPANERNEVAKWLDETLTKEVRPGGTVLRRLNREEYENTVRKVLGIPFSVPQSFPADTESHGFDNIGEGLLLSPPLMAKYVEMATIAADEILPPLAEEIEIPSKKVEIDPDGFVLNFTTGHVIDGVLRMGTSSDPLSRGSVWLNRFEARARGIYDIEIDISAYKPTPGHVPEVHLLAKPAAGSNYAKASTLRKLAEFKIESGVKTFKTTAELHRGETVVVHYENAPLSSDFVDRSEYLNRLSSQLAEAFREDPELGAAWVKAGYQRSDRGWSWWDRILKIRDTEELDVAGFDVESKKVQDALRLFARQSVNTVETMACMNFFKGPGIDIHQMAITGPSEVFVDEDVLDQRKRTARFLGERGEKDDRAFAESALRKFLDKAFRRPVTDAQLKKYVDIALGHQAEGYRLEDGLHLSVRLALCSTHFLYRGNREGVLDDYDLASRLSYFLSSCPPDDSLRKFAASGQLSDPAVLEKHTRRLLKQGTIKNFLSSFTGQWLDLRLLPQIMPDPRLLKWIDKDLKAVTDETNMFVEEILKKNHPLETFIDPDFTYLNRRNAKLYNIDFSKSDTMERVTLEKGGRNGGILTQASVLMATANGVDTQPVLRGAWMLENIFGMPTPPPPDSVPAIEPDTSGAKSIRELLDKHKADVSCARCHRKIDPAGFVLENFDPVGRWRDHYPVYVKKGDRVVTEKGLLVDSVATMPDGTELKDVRDLKAYLVANIDIFSKCLAEKLLIYGTGRPMNYGDHKVIEKVVKDVKARGNGFADLIVEVVKSESFRTK